MDLKAARPFKLSTSPTSTSSPPFSPKFPSDRSGAVAKKWFVADVETKFKETRHLKKIGVREKRSA